MHRTLRLASVDSTNAEAMRRVVTGEAGPLWIVADAQSSGRGRMGRAWSSPLGNLYASLLINLASPAPKAYQLSLVTGIAVMDAVAAAMGTELSGQLRLKWPNDILIGNAKVGGILIESSTGASGLAAAIGIGINIVSNPDLPDRPATNLAVHGAAPDRDTLLAAIAAAMEIWIGMWAEGEGFPAVREAWLARCGALGQRVSVNTGTERIEGTFCGVDADGALLVQEADGRERRVSFGDVTLAAPVSGQESI